MTKGSCTLRGKRKKENESCKAWKSRIDLSPTPIICFNCEYYYKYSKISPSIICKLTDCENRVSACYKPVSLWTEECTICKYSSYGYGHGTNNYRPTKPPSYQSINKIKIK